MKEIADITFEILFVMIIMQMIVFAIFLRINKISASGSSPINPILFRFGKITMFICWASVFVQSTGSYNLQLWGQNMLLPIIAVAVFLVGFAIQVIAYFNLGKNLKFGIPGKQEQEQATLKTEGIYYISRNPMYAGFYLMTVASGLYVLNPIIWALAIFTIMIHHSIVIKEEKFLKERFGHDWEKYISEVRRYI